MFKRKTKKELAAREKLFAKQIAERGFSDEQTWSLDSVLAELFLPVLKANKVDKRVINCFTLIEKGDWNWGDTVSIGPDGWQKRYTSAIKKMQAEVDAGLKLFPKEFFKLPPKAQNEILKITVPRLRRFKELTNGWPSVDELPTFESWIAVIDEILLGFTQWWIATDSPIKVDNKREIRQNMQKSLKLFTKWFQGLWW